jgi:hypothetical protein
MKASLALLSALGLLALGSGCQDNWQSFFIHDNKRIGTPPECAIPTDENAAGLLGGVLDASIASGYAAYLFVENGMISRADPGLPDAESNGILLQGAYLYYEPDPLCPAAFPSMEARFSNYLPPGGGSTIGIWIIPPSIGALMNAAAAGCPGGMDVTVTVQMFGVSQGGIDMLTQEFDYPVHICSGCLVSCPIGMSCPAGATPWGFTCDCGDTDVEQGEVPCHPGQDDMIDCRLVPPCT